MYVEILLRSILSFVFLLLIAKMLGARQISQLSYFDYILGITLGSMASSLAIDDVLSVWKGLIGMAVFGLFTFLLSILSRKSIRARRFFEGKPRILINEGKIMYNELKKAQFSINDLLRELRTQGYFNIADVNFALQETNGMLSVMPKGKKRPVVAEDLNLAPPEQGLCANVIIDGKIMAANLKAVGKDIRWLADELEKQGILAEDAVLATVDKDYNLSVYKKENLGTGRTTFQ